MKGSWAPMFGGRCKSNRESGPQGMAGVALVHASCFYGISFENGTICNDNNSCLTSGSSVGASFWMAKLANENAREADVGFCPGLCSFVDNRLNLGYYDKAKREHASDPFHAGAMISTSGELPEFKVPVLDPSISALPVQSALSPPRHSSTRSIVYILQRFRCL